MTFQSLVHTSCRKYAQEIRCSARMQSQQMSSLQGHAVKSKGLCTVSTTGGTIAGEWVSGDMVILLLHCLHYLFHSIDMKSWWKVADIVIWSFWHFVVFRARDCSISTFLCKVRETRILAVDMITGQLLWIIEDIQTERAGYLLLEFI